MNLDEPSAVVLPAPSGPAVPARYHSLDALRAFALLLGVVFHAALPLVVPGGYWAVGTSEPISQFISWFVYYAHAFRMELFFLLAGFFSRMMLLKRGPAAFARDRFKRIVLVFLILLYPLKLLLALAWISGGLKTGWLDLPPEVAALPLWKLGFGALGQEAWPNINLTHLWFLYYLAIISAFALGLFSLALRFPRFDSSPLFHAFSLRAISWLFPFAAAVLTTPILSLMNDVVVETPDKGFTWQFPVLALYGLYFLAGWAIHREEHLLRHFARFWSFYLIGSLVVSLPSSMISGVRSTGSPTALEYADLLRWSGSFGTSLTMSLAVFGFIGLFGKFLDREIGWIRYLVGAAYWIYLAHLPLVAGLQVLFAGTNLHWIVTIFLETAITVLILLLLYHWLIRHTFIGGKESRSAKMAP